ncbi:MAG: FkbM family methyltransferase, partial [Thermomicrobiales bacterium]
MRMLRPDTPLLGLVRRAAPLAEEPFALLDIGCSGGVPTCFRAFGGELVAVGVDPNLAEVERLQRAEAMPGVSYLAGYVGLPEDDPFMVKRRTRDWWSNNPWDRLTAASFKEMLAARAGDVSQLTEINAWPAVSLADNHHSWTLDALAEVRLGRPPDFVKIDVDGADLAVILSGVRTLADPRTLGVGVEVNYFGTADPMDNTFHNIDRELRARGFELFDLTVRRYSTTALPARFEFPTGGQTQSGRIYQGDALYLRDLAAAANARQFEAATAPGLLKLICLFDLFGLPDCAAEIAMAASDRIEPLIPVASVLDALTLGVYPNAGSHAAVAELWDNQPEAFLPERGAG